MKKDKPVEDELTLKYVPSTIQQWKRNKKKHDIQALIRMFVKHGFKDPLKWEPTMNNGAGGIVEGNGRDEALLVMRNQNEKKPPRGIKIDPKLGWMVPVLFGVDAKSQAAAESYGFDHNNATMMGSGMDADDIMSMYEDGTQAILQELYGAGELPISIQANDLDQMLEADREQLSETEEEIRPKNMLRILISVPAAVAIDVQGIIENVKTIPGVEVDYSGN